MNQSELNAIKKRVENLSKANVLRDLDALAKNNRVVFEDVPKLLAEIKYLRVVISRLRCDECGDELGNNWREKSGVALCEWCSESDAR